MPDAERTIVHLIRHGDALPADDDVVAGAAGYDDLGLSPKGVRQARALGARLARTTDLAAIYASPTRRAFETATHLAEACARSIAPDPRLREIYLGDEAFPEHLDPRARATAIRERLADLAAIALRDGSWSAVPGAEAADAVAARVGAAVDDAVRAHRGAHVALVSHAGAINAYLARVLAVPSAFFFPIGNTSLSSVRVDETSRLVLRLNDIAHLEPLAERVAS